MKLDRKRIPSGHGSVFETAANDGAPTMISRRTFAAGCLAGSALSWLASGAGFAAVGTAPAGGKKSKIAVVPTMTGPVRCDALGTTLMHEGPVCLARRQVALHVLVGEVYPPDI